MSHEAAIRHCISCCDGALTDDQRVELHSRIYGAIEVERDRCARRVDNLARILSAPYVDPDPANNTPHRIAVTHGTLAETAAGVIRNPVSNS